MTKLTLDQAQEILIDKEAIKRKTLTDEVIEVAYKLVELSGTYGESFLNDLYWIEVIPEIDNLSSRQYGNACDIAEWLVKNEKRN